MPDPSHRPDGFATCSGLAALVCGPILLARGAPAGWSSLLITCGLILLSTQWVIATDMRFTISHRTQVVVALAGIAFVAIAVVYLTQRGQRPAIAVSRPRRRLGTFPNRPGYRHTHRRAGVVRPKPRLDPSHPDAALPVAECLSAKTTLDSGQVKYLSWRVRSPRTWRSSQRQRDGRRDGHRTEPSTANTASQLSPQDIVEFGPFGALFLGMEIDPLVPRATRSNQSHATCHPSYRPNVPLRLGMSHNRQPTRTFATASEAVVSPRLATFLR